MCATWRCQCSIRTLSWPGGRRPSPAARQRRCGGNFPRPGSCPTCASSASRTSTTSASRCRTSSPRPSGPTTPTTRCGSCSGTRAPTSTSTGSRAASPSPSSTRTDRPRGARSCSAPRTCRRARSAAAIGELVSRLGATGFEGYWNNDEANMARVHDGIYWTGDLAYRDEQGYFYFAGRDYDWLRVDGENFSAAPVERILARHPDVVLAAVYAVPDPDVGDRVMAALQLRPGVTFDPEDFAAFLAAQPDLGTKWAPRFVRIAATLPVTETSK